MLLFKKKKKKNVKNAGNINNVLYSCLFWRVKDNKILNVTEFTL